MSTSTGNGFVRWYRSAVDDLQHLPDVELGCLVRLTSIADHRDGTFHGSVRDAFRLIGARGRLESFQQRVKQLAKLGEIELPPRPVRNQWAAEDGRAFIRIVHYDEITRGVRTGASADPVGDPVGDPESGSADGRLAAETSPEEVQENNPPNPPEGAAASAPAAPSRRRSTGNRPRRTKESPRVERIRRLVEEQQRERNPMAGDEIAKLLNPEPSDETEPEEAR